MFKTRNLGKDHSVDNKPTTALMDVTTSLPEVPFPSSASSHILETKNLEKDYFVDKKPTPALCDVSLSFPEVQFVAILGPSGCGKTTLLNLLGGLDRPSHGEIFFQGEPLSKKSEKELDSYRNNAIGFVFQNYYLIPQLSVLENVKVALEVRDTDEKTGEEKAIASLKEVGIDESMFHKRPNELSGGQAQRVAIARALVTNPKILLADEPTGALDSKNSVLIMDILKKCAKDHLVILVTHNEELASQYADRIISLKDGKVESDILVTPEKETQAAPIQTKKSHLSFFLQVKLALRNMRARLGKSILTGVANSFALIGIGFLLAMNLGFREYSTRLSEEAASSLPVVVNAYDEENQSQSFSDSNASIAYTDAQEIYPSVDSDSSTTYVANAFNVKYFSYLDSLKEKGILRNYTVNYGSDYAFNLTTQFPKSLDGQYEAQYREVNTQSNSWNYYAYLSSLPYNVFHVLYGNLDDYDLIAGSYPTSSNQIVLVVNKYNAVNFSILCQLGFYSPYDTQEEVKDASLNTKVKPISFKDVLNKEYRIFTNNQYFASADEKDVTDAFDSTRTIKRYTTNSLSQEFYESGKELQICGILRPKETSSYVILSPALCYLPSLQQELVDSNEASDFASCFAGNVVFHKQDSEKETEDTVTLFLNELHSVMGDYLDGKTDILPTDNLDEVLNKYFTCYYPKTSFSSSGYYVYTSISSFLNDARRYGCSLVQDDLIGVNLAKRDEMQKQMDKITDDFMAIKGTSDTENITDVYNDILSLIAYSKAYSLISSVVLFPTNLDTRSQLISALDDYNSLDGDPSHASSSAEQVFYRSEESNAMVQDVGEMIGLVSSILIIFALVSSLVSIALTSVLTSNNVIERRKEIGLLRSLGSRKQDVISLFEWESFFQAILAGVLGSLLTFALSFPINALLQFYYPSYHVGSICHFTYWHVLILLAYALILGLLASFLPARKASKEDPAKALRSE